MSEELKPRPSCFVAVSLKFVLAFIALRQVFHELHEFGHMTAARLLCGEFGMRDFNRVAAIPASCEVTPGIDAIVALAGPMFNFCAIWLGAVLIRNARSAKTVSWGLCLIFASLPMARLVTALFGGGDEVGLARTYLENPLLARVLVTLAICAVLAFPLRTAYRALSPARHRAWLFAGFLVLPMLLEGAVVLTFLNYLLIRQGLLDQTLAFGAPGLVLAVLLLAVVVCLVLGPHLATLVRNRPLTPAQQ